MSSTTGENLSGISADPDLQEINSEKGPQFEVLRQAFQDTYNGNQLFRDICEQNAMVRYARWPGQSFDGKKHSRDKGKTEPTPWDGASDLQVFLADEAINSYVAMEGLAMQKANIVAVPVEGNDIKRAKNVSNFMRWLIKTQIVDFDREMELLSQFVHEKGLAVTGQFWEVKQDKTLQKIRLDEFQEQFPQINVQEMLMVDSLEDDLIALFEELYGCSRRKAKKMIGELRMTGETTVPVIGKVKSRPVIRAFNLDEDVFIASNTADLEDASGIYRLQYFTPEKLRMFVHTDGWDEAWVEKAIECALGKQISPSNDDTYFGQQNYRLDAVGALTPDNYKGKVGVVYAYQRLSDEDGFAGIYCTKFNPYVPPDEKQKGYAKYDLLGYAHGQYPFVLHRREYLSRKLYDTRGIPEPARPWQNQIKAHRDARIDAASMAILPPFMHPIGRPPTKWGPGARVGERRPGEYHFGDAPAPSQQNTESEVILEQTWNKYVGFNTTGEATIFDSVKPQFQINKRLNGLSKAFNQVLSLYSQYGPKEVAYRVIGMKQAEPVIFERGSPDEEFDFFLTWDIQNMDPEVQEKKLQALAQVCATFDRNGQIDYSEVLQIAVDIIDPNWAERIIQPKEVGTQRVVNDTQGALAQIFAGVDKDREMNDPPELQAQVLQGYIQAQDVQARYEQDESFRARLDKYAKQVKFGIQQRENARIGRMGA
jgi:hypothetical protein